MLWKDTSISPNKGAGIYDLKIGDVNSDGKNDIALGGTWIAYESYIYEQIGTNKYSLKTVLKGTEVRSIDIADFDNNGRNEILAGTGPGDHIIVLQKIKQNYRPTLGLKSGTVSCVRFYNMDNKQPLELLYAHNHKYSKMKMPIGIYTAQMRGGKLVRLPGFYKFDGSFEVVNVDEKASDELLFSHGLFQYKHQNFVNLLPIPGFHGTGDLDGDGKREYIFSDDNTYYICGLKEKKDLLTLSIKKQINVKVPISMWEKELGLVRDLKQMKFKEEALAKIEEFKDAPISYKTFALLEKADIFYTQAEDKIKEKLFFKREGATSSAIEEHWRQAWEIYTQIAQQSPLFTAKALYKRYFLELRLGDFQQAYQTIGKIIKSSALSQNQIQKLREDQKWLKRYFQQKIVFRSQDLKKYPFPNAHPLRYKLMPDGSLKMQIEERGDAWAGIPLIDQGDFFALQGEIRFERISFNTTLTFSIYEHPNFSTFQNNHIMQLKIGNAKSKAENNTYYLGVLKINSSPDSKTWYSFKKELILPANQYRLWQKAKNNLIQQSYQTSFSNKTSFQKRNAKRYLGVYVPMISKIVPNKQFTIVYIRFEVIANPLSISFLHNKGCWGEHFPHQPHLNFFYLANGYFSTNNYAKALFNYHKTLSIKKDFIEAYIYRAAMFYEIAQKKQAKKQKYLQNAKKDLLAAIKINGKKTEKIISQEAPFDKGAFLSFAQKYFAKK